MTVVELFVNHHTPQDLIYNHLSNTIDTNAINNVLPQESQELLDNVTDSIDNYLTNIVKAAEHPHVEGQMRAKEMIETISVYTEKVTSLDETQIATLLMNTSLMARLTSNISKNLKNVLSSIKLTDEALVITSLLVQSLIIMRIKQSLIEHEKMHSELSQMALQYPEDTSIQENLAQLDLVLTHLNNTLIQTEELSIQNWMQILSATAEQTVSILENFLPSLAALQVMGQAAGVASDIVIIAFASHSIASCHQKDVKLSDRQKELEFQLVGEKDPTLLNFLKVELDVVNRSIEETSIELLRNCTVLSSSIGIAAIMTTHIGLVAAGVSTAPVTWPLMVFGSAVTLGVLGYQYRHELQLYTDLGKLYLSNYRMISKHEKQVEEWSVNQSKVEIALNTTELVNRIALEMSDSIHMLVLERNKINKEMAQTSNPIKKAYLTYQLFLLDQEEKAILSEKTRRINNVLDNYEAYRKELPILQGKISELEQSIITSTAELKDYVVSKQEIQHTYKGTKIGTAIKKNLSDDALKEQIEQLKILRKKLVLKKERFQLGQASMSEKFEMKRFFEREISQVDFEIRAIQIALKDSRSKKKLAAESKAVYQFHRIKFDERSGSQALHNNLDVICHQIRSEVEREKLLQYFEERIISVNSGISRQELRKYLLDQLLYNPKNFLAWMCFQQHQCKYYTETLATKEMIDSVFPPVGKDVEVQEYNEGIELSRPHVSLYLAIPENKLRLKQFIIALLNSEGINWNADLEKLKEFESSLSKVLDSGDILQQEALFRRYHLVNSFNRFTPEISNLLIPPASVEDSIAQQFGAKMQGPMNHGSQTHLIELAIFSLGIMQKSL